MTVCLHVFALKSMLACVIAHPDPSILLSMQPGRDVSKDVLVVLAPCEYSWDSPQLRRWKELFQHSWSVGCKARERERERETGCPLQVCWSKQIIGAMLLFLDCACLVLCNSFVFPL